MAEKAHLTGTSDAVPPVNDDVVSPVRGDAVAPFSGNAASPVGNAASPVGGDAAVTRMVTRGVRRLLASLDQPSLTEVTVKSGRRADVMAIDGSGGVTIVEVKVSVGDLRGDRKWPEYRDWCDRLYFAVPPDFPQDLVPVAAGLIVADDYGGAILREAPDHRLAAARRKALTQRFARLSAQRLHRLEDPNGVQSAVLGSI